MSRAKMARHSWTHWFNAGVAVVEALNLVKDAFLDLASSPMSHAVMLFVLAAGNMWLRQYRTSQPIARKGSPAEPDPLDAPRPPRRPRRSPHSARPPVQPAPDERWPS